MLKRTFVLCSALLLGWTLSLTPTLAQDKAVAPVAASATEIMVGPAKLTAGDTIVFLGDSITHQRLYTQYIEDFFMTRFPDVKLNFHNSGIGGDRAWDAVARLDRDVLAMDPSLVTILLGMNDGRYVPFDAEIFETYRTDMSTLLDGLAKSDAAVVPITPTMFDAQAARQQLQKRPRDEQMMQQYNAVLAYFGTWLRGEADRRGLRSIDMFSPLNQLTRQARQVDPAFTFIADAIHPGPDGQLIMAFAWLQDLGVQRSVSNIVVSLNPKGQRVARATGGTVSEISGDESRVEFTFAGRSLPWVVPDEAQMAAKMLNLGHKMSKEGLQVHSLPAGKYRLSIDGTEIGVFGHTSLASHIELQKYTNTPQYQQAAKVAAMNAERNNGPVKALRDHWYIVRNLNRVRRDSQANPNDEGLAKKLEEAEKKAVGFEERLVELEAAAQQSLDAIYEINQPQPHHYVIERVQ
ncbi:SGNH/GDSL hydrolase family protein [Stieleria varia]|uniref:GDSL-like Lipase/Acylhydrolase n=1 Tax=Stieleria varia TaxID=2528005 RepID=A0A5C5ZYL3_9BACT|nr:SGNH/GDSL hydrolase family protein [Stieleria varia]TWT92369.1 GDSL-like Lipase/Acylhydrolase [Stieleria varia]